LGQFWFAFRICPGISFSQQFWLNVIHHTRHAFKSILK
jgi:hypothetical protein